MLDTSINVKTDHFDGPLSLLLLLVQKEEMDIRELDLTKITKQYLDYLAGMKKLNFDVAGDYLYLAATLLLLKSKSAVSMEEANRMREEMGAENALNITSHSELVRRLEELAHFQRMGAKLWELPRMGEEIFVKPKINRKEIINSILLPMDLGKLTTAMMDFIQKEKRKYTVVRRDRLSIKEKLKFLKEFLEMGKKTDFDTLLDNDGERGIDNIVITFISLLELARLKRIQIFQNEAMGNIYVDVVKSLADFDVEQANGFEDEEELEKKNEEELQDELNELIEENVMVDVAAVEPENKTLQ